MRQNFQQDSWLHSVRGMGRETEIKGTKKEGKKGVKLGEDKEAKKSKGKEKVNEVCLLHPCSSTATR